MATATTDRTGDLAALLALPAGLVVLVTLAGCADRAPPPLWPEPPPPTLADPIGEPVVEERPAPAVEPVKASPEPELAASEAAPDAEEGAPEPTDGAKPAAPKG